MFCKVFNLPVWAYVAGGIILFVLYVLVSWAMDKFKMIETLQELIWNKTPQVKQILKDK